MWKIRGGRERGQAGSLCFICFFLGLAAGTLAGNWICGREWLSLPLLADVQSRWGVGLWQSPWRKQPGNGGKLLYLLQRRLGEGALGWILGLNVCAAPAFCLLALYGGFSLGWVITCCTLEEGLLGLLAFLLSCFPQMLFYLPVWGLLVWWGLGERRKIRLLPTLAAAVFLGLGAAAEAFWNPLFLRLLK